MMSVINYLSTVLLTHVIYRDTTQFTLLILQKTPNVSVSAKHN